MKKQNKLNANRLYYYYKLTDGVDILYCNIDMDLEPHRVPKVIRLDNYRATRCTYEEYENNSNCIEVNE